MAKQILTGKPLREKLLSGTKQLSDTVTITLGPKGRNVGLEKKFVDPVVIHDGVKVAKEIDLPDPYENFAAQLVKQVSAKTADRAGDGTTTSTLLAYEMIKQGFEHIESGANSVTLKAGMEQALSEILAVLEKRAKPITTEEQKKQVAALSSASKEIGDKVGEAVDRVGQDGVVDVIPYEGMDIQVEVKEGMEFDRGYVSSQFATKDDGSAEVEAPYILLTTQVVNDASALAGFLKSFTKETNRMEIVIIAPDITGAALSTLIVNKARGGILPLGIFAPAIGERQKQIMEDLAVLTGGTVIEKDAGIPLDQVLIEQLGRADRIITDANKTKIVGGFGDPDKIARRVALLKEQIAKEPKEFEKKKLKERLARLSAGAAVIKVGALTEVELSDRIERVIDAVEATKAAVAEGIVAGGGQTFLGLRTMFTEPKEELELGKFIVHSSLNKPYRKLLENAGLEMPSSLEKEEGVDVTTGKVVNLYHAGIIDPARVIKEALQNAVSVAGMILTTEAVVADIPEDTIKTFQQ